MARHAERPPDDHDDPHVVDLARYKRARQQLQAKARAQQKAAGAQKSGGEPLLGSRPRAGLILAAVALAVILIWVLSSIR
jgi:hypothetical protein